MRPWAHALLVRAARGLTITEHTEDRYRLNRDHLDVDLWRFHTAFRQAVTAVTDTTSAWQTVIDADAGDLAASRTWPSGTGPNQRRGKCGRPGAHVIAHPTPHC
jgi:hypothetical protein